MLSLLGALQKMAAQSTNRPTLRGAPSESQSNCLFLFCCWQSVSSKENDLIICQVETHLVLTRSSHGDLEAAVCCRAWLSRYKMGEWISLTFYYILPGHHCGIHSFVAVFASCVLVLVEQHLPAFWNGCKISAFQSLEGTTYDCKQLTFYWWFPKRFSGAGKHVYTFPVSLRIATRNSWMNVVFFLATRCGEIPEMQLPRCNIPWVLATFTSVWTDRRKT